MLVYYTHIPLFLLSVALGFFMLLSDRKDPTNRNLFFFILLYIFWVMNDLLQWIIVDPVTNLLLARIAIIQIFSVLFFLLFVYSFAGLRLSVVKKILISLPFVPVVVFMFTDFNIRITNFVTCNTEFGALYYYIYMILTVYITWSVWILLKRAKSREINEEKRQQIKIVIRAITFVALWFLLFMALTQVSVKFNFAWGDSIFLYTPVGMGIFVGLLVYAITKYKFLDIKLIAAQALTYLIWLLIGSQYFFADSGIVYMLITLTLLLSIIFGIMLIKSVKQEVERKEQLQIMADKLASANDQLRKLDNAKTEFISIASHQLRTPITAIKGFSSLLLEGSYGEISESVHGALEKVYTSAERLVNLIEDLLNVSRIESGRMTFTFEPSSVEKLLKELYDNFILIAKTKKFYLELKLPENPFPEIIMDYSKIRELTSNFIDNALKYTEKGGVTIKAEIKNEGVVIDENGFVIEGKKSEFGKMVRITVSDTGIGIPKEEIPYLFKKFSRGKDVSRLHVGGTGLGLYVGKAIAEAHHGQVWVESDGAGKGSRFIIEIPLEHID